MPSLGSRPLVHPQNGPSSKWFMLKMLQHFGPSSKCCKNLSIVIWMVNIWLNSKYLKYSVTILMTLKTQILILPEWILQVILHVLAWFWHGSWKNIGWFMYYTCKIPTRFLEDFLLENLLNHCILSLCSLAFIFHVLLEFAHSLYCFLIAYFVTFFYLF